jgi:hypothetical protein
MEAGTLQWEKKRQRKNRASQCTILEFSLSVHNPGVQAAAEKKVVTAKERRRASRREKQAERERQKH